MHSTIAQKKTSLKGKPQGKTAPLHLEKIKSRKEEIFDLETANQITSRKERKMLPLKE